MRIVLTGAGGLVGKDLWSKLESHSELWAVGRKKPDTIPPSRWKSLDIIDPELTIKTIHQINPDCVIHSAALSNPDQCETNPELGYKTNALGTRNIALACQKFDTELLYISSDQIFDGNKKTSYRETDSPNPINKYGCSKLWGEQMVQTLIPRFYIVRTSLVFGTLRPTFIDQVVASALKQEPLIAATDIVNSPTYSKDLADAISFLINKHLYGIYHIANEGFTSRYALSKTIASILKKKSDFIKKGNKNKLKLKAPRPGFTPLENFFWNLSEFPKIAPWEDALIRFLKEKGTLS
ncbi:MAG: dTDP-4-dehydrorhamnose reductase [Elusimicrobia bacterium]|nr:dTDP-4-dehydrorhamnose reductase [Elusimicrobiota bacterium]